MYFVYKNDNFITKLFACLIISLFVIMCFIGSKVFASGSFVNFDTTFPIGDAFDEYYCVFLVSKSNDGYYHLEYKYSNEPIKAEKISDSEYRLHFTGHYNGSSSNSQSLNVNFFNLDSLNPPTVTSTSTTIGGSRFNQSIVFFANNDVLDYNDNSSVVFSSNSSIERGATGDANYDSYINGLIGSNGGNLSVIASDITNGDIGNSVENSDKTSIFNISSKLGGGFSKIFGFFSFVDTVKNSIVDIYNLLINTTEAPKLYMTFNHQYIQGEYCILDFSWYAPYKEFGDGIICAFMYACFMWHVFSNLYNIISGQNSVVSSAESYMTSSVPGVVSGK